MNAEEVGFFLDPLENVVGRELHDVLTDAGCNLQPQDSVAFATPLSGTYVVERDIVGMATLYGFA